MEKHVYKSVDDYINSYPDGIKKILTEEFYQSAGSRG